MDYYLDTVAGASSATAGAGTRTKPFKTWTEAAAVVRTGDTVWINGTISEQITLTAIPNLTLRRWKNEKFTCDGGGARQFGVRVNSGTNNLTIIGAIFTGATQHGFSHVGDATGIRLFDCDAHSNTLNGFASEPTTSKGMARLYGCLSYDNGNDGFSVKGAATWYLYDCVATGHDSGLSTDGYTTHDDAVMHCFRCVAGDNTKGFSFTHNTGSATVAGCFSYDSDIGVFHVPASTSLTAGMKHPRTLVYGSVFHLGGGALGNSANYGIGCAQGAFLEAYCNTIYNKGSTNANISYSMGISGPLNSGGLATRMIAIGNVSELHDADAEAMHVNLSGFPDEFAYNVYRIQSGNRYAILGAGLSRTLFLQNAEGHDATSTEVNAAVLRGEPSSEANLPNARNTASVPTMPNLKTLLEQRGWLSTLDALAWIDETLARPDFELHRSTRILRFAPSRDLRWSGVVGGVRDLAAEAWNPGAFVESALSTSTLAYVNSGPQSGALLVVGHDINTAVSDQLVNRYTIQGDISRRVVITGGSIVGGDSTNPMKVVLWANKKAHGQPILVTSTLGGQLSERALPPGEDCYLEIGDPGTAEIVSGEIRYRIEPANLKAVISKA